MSCGSNIILYWHAYLNFSSESFEQILIKHIDLIDKRLKVCLKDTPMHSAAGVNNHMAISMLLKHGSTSINAKDINGDTPLHIATRSKSVDAVRALLSSGCHVDICNNNKMTAIHEACKNNDIDVLSVFCECRKDMVNVVDDDGNSLIHLAIKYGHYHTVEILMQWGCKMINSKNKNGMHPLHQVLYIRDAPYTAYITEILATWGCNIDQLDRNGYTPLDVALLSAPLKNMAVLLIALGAYTKYKDDYHNYYRSLILSEQEIADIRYRVYFARSLTSRLCFDPDIY